MFNKGATDQIPAVRVMIEFLAVIFNTRSPPKGVVRGFAILVLDSGGNVCLVVVDEFGFSPVDDNPVAKLRVIEQFGQ